MKEKVYKITVNIDGKEYVERFLSKKNMQEWLAYTGKKPIKYEEVIPKSIFDTLCTYEAKYFPTGREYGNFIELALGKKLGLSPRTWIPNPNPDKTYWRLVD